MDFIILKVNGKDVSQSSHEEAVEAFLTAEEPITVEVLRRGQQQQEPNSSQSSKRNSVYIPPSTPTFKESVAIQTDVILGVSDVVTSCQNGDVEYEEEEEDVVVDMEDSSGDLLVPGLDYEEVVLSRSSGEERLGLTLCYETDAEDGLTDIFIDDIHPDGLAAKDGRLRLGDQIIQINGEDIKTKSQAQDIFLHSNGDISFLVARPPSHYNGSHHNHNDELDFCEDEEEALLSCEPPLDTMAVVEDDVNGVSPQSKFSNRSSTTESGDSVLMNNKKNSENTDYIFTSQSSNGSVNNNLLSKVRKASSSSQDSGHRTTEDLNTSKSSKSNSSAGSDSIKDAACTTTSSVVGFISSAAAAEHNNDMNIDKELYYVDKKLKDIRLDCEAISAKHNFQQNNRLMSTSLHVQQQQQSEPIYETIPEVSENDDQVYSMPFDTVANKQMHPLVSPVRKKPHHDQSSRKSRTKSCEKNQPNRLSRSTSLNKYDKNKNFEEPIVDCDPVRDAKLKEVETWLKQSLAPPLVSPPKDFRSSKNNSRASPGKNAGPTLQLSHLGQESSGSTLSLVKQQPPPPLAKKPQKRTVVGKMPLKGTMPRPQSLAPSDIMYTDVENLQATMKMQQEMMLRQQSRKSPSCQNPPPLALQRQYQQQQQQAALMIQQQQQQQQHQGRAPAVFQAPPPPPVPPPPMAYNVNQPQSASGNDDWEWKVKIRPDGTRYITRRPARNRFLKERAKRVSEERNSGLTTDDDNMSELKVGKYWSKDERKRHLEQAKDRRKKQLALIHAKNESLKKSPSASASLGCPKYSNAKSPTPPANQNGLSSAGSGGSNPLLNSTEPVLLSVATV